MRKEFSPLLAISACLLLASAASASAASPHHARVKASGAAVKSAPALRVISATPSNNALGNAPITVRLSVPLPATALPTREMPRLSPTLAGRWSQTGPKTLQFTPTSAYPQGQKVTVTVPTALTDARGGRLQRPYQFSYTVMSYSPVRLVQLLAQLGYLPVTFHPAAGTTAPALSDRLAQMQAAFSPPRGTLVLGKGWPAQLNGLWEHDRSVVLDGAIRAFEAQHDLTMDGVASPQLWAALLKAAVAGQRNTVGYTYAVASEGSPETLTIWRNGSEVLHSLANTGVAGATTTPGTYPVYEKLQSQVMRGTNLDGSTYADQVYWVSYFNGGDAVHYFDRASYGFPQSLGCVELPSTTAEAAYGYLTYGSLVTVDAP
jgi:L,D-transpeptidase catalytic domain/Bacterial Ig-like domain